MLMSFVENTFEIIILRYNRAAQSDTFSTHFELKWSTCLSYNHLLSSSYTHTQHNRQHGPHE